MTENYPLKQAPQGYVPNCEMLGIMAVPADELPFTSWLYMLVSSKLIAVAAGYIFHRLYLRWEKRGTIDELTNFVSNY